ncbi:MAG TPA: SH3 domain-containing protein [Candidatus Binatia bacterium]|nr:SH3 domain-containing protein [Candidatus Binatia bacterium]
MAPRIRTRRLAGVAIAVCTLALGGCSLASSSPSPTVSKATPTPLGTSATPANGSPLASPTPTPQTSGVRTVLVQDGLRIHSAPSLTAQVLGTVTWGNTLTVTGYSTTGGPWPGSSTPGAWYHVQGATTTGWVIADPSYTAEGTLNSIDFADKHIDGVLFPSDWTYADDPGEVVFEPQSGTDLPTLTLRIAPTLSALGAAGLSGYSPVSSNAKEVVCGYTGTEVDYASTSGAAAQSVTDAGGAKVTRLQHFAQFRATLSDQVAIDIEMNYSTTAQYAVFQNLLNSIKYPFPLCEAAPSPSPSPTPR